MSVTGETFSQAAPNASVRGVRGHSQLQFTFGAQIFFTPDHGTVTGSYGHRTHIDAGIASLAVIRAYVKWKSDMTVFSSPYKAQGFGPPGLTAGPDTTAAEGAVLVVEGVSNRLHPAPNGYILNSPGIGSLRYKHFRYVFANSKNLFSVGMNNHAVPCLESA